MRKECAKIAAGTAETEGAYRAKKKRKKAGRKGTVGREKKERRVE